MNSCLNVLTPLAGVAVLALAGWIWRSGSKDQGWAQSAYGAMILLAVGVFLLIDGTLLWFRPVNHMLLQWLVVLLVVALACVAGRMTRRPTADVNPDPLVDSRMAEDIAAGFLQRADFHQVDVDLVLGRLDEFDAIRRGFGVDAACAIEQAFAHAVRTLAPPDALVWRTGPGTVVVLGHLTKAAQAELAMAMTEALAEEHNMRQLGVRPEVHWFRTSTAEAGYALADLEMAAASAARS